MSDATDCQLLERYVTQRDEAAFALVARRHAALVLRVCRRVLGNEADAEDVAQATFLVLARKALAVAWRPSVGGWLLAVAHRLALHARATSARRGLRETPIGSFQDVGCLEPIQEECDPLGEAQRWEVCSILHEEVHRLPEKYRVPVVLCYLEGKTNEQAARELGWPTGSMSRRLERARRLLRQRLAGRGLGILLLVLATALIPLVWPSRPQEPLCRAAEPASVFSGPRLAEAILQAAVRGEPVERGDLAATAQRAAQVARLLEDYDPGVERALWQQRTRELSQAAAELTQATENEDLPRHAAAAGQLYAVCTRCHRTFRD